MIDGGDSLPRILHAHTRHLHLGQCQCDCACAVDIPSVPATVELGQELWVKQAKATSLTLEGEWRAFYNPVGPVGVAALNGVAREVLAAFDSPASPTVVPGRVPEVPPAVIRDAVNCLAQIGLLQPVEERSPAPTQPTILAAWLHVTEACNLNCPYCYVHRRPGTMSANVGRYAVDRLVEMASRDGYSTLKLKYAGGEPTLNFSVIRAIHAHAAHRTEEAGLALQEVVLTNGVGVTDEMLDFMASTGIRLMVSLDGGPEAHDRVRARRNGQSTHTAVVDTVKRAMARGLQPDISITLTALNVEGVVEATAFALERGLPFSLNFYRECSPGAGAPSPLAPDPDQLVTAVQKVFALVRMYPDYPVPLAGILDRTRLDVPHHYPCSAGRDYVAVDTNGQVSACQMLLKTPWADMMDEDPLTTIRSRGTSIFKPVEERPGCRTCLWRAACSGGCPLMRQNVLHERYCQVYRTLLPELVCLEADRLIALQS